MSHNNNSTNQLEPRESEEQDKTPKDQNIEII